MNDKKAEATSTADREISTTRIFDAPRELVWKVWTEPNHIARWWGPKGFTNTIHTMDVKPGGVWISLCMVLTASIILTRFFIVK